MQKTLMRRKGLEEHLRARESRYIKALELYYSKFGLPTGSVTFNEAAHRAKVNPAYLVDYLFYCPRKIGVPESRGEAVTYLRKLRNYKGTLA